MTQEHFCLGVSLLALAFSGYALGYAIGTRRRIRKAWREALESDGSKLPAGNWLKESDKE